MGGSYVNAQVYGTENPQMYSLKASIDHINKSIPWVKKEKIDSINKKAINIIQQIKNLKKSKMPESADFESFEKIEYLYKISENSIWEADTLIALADRMKGVKALHEKSPMFGSQLDQIHEQDKLIKSSLDKNEKLWAEVTEEIKSAMADILKDVSDLESKIFEAV